MYRSAKGTEGIDWPTCFFETLRQYLRGKTLEFCGIEFGTDHNLCFKQKLHCHWCEDIETNDQSYGIWDNLRMI